MNIPTQARRLGGDVWASGLMPVNDGDSVVVRMFATWGRDAGLPDVSWGLPS